MGKGKVKEEESEEDDGLGCGSKKAKHQPLASQGLGQSQVKRLMEVSSFFLLMFSLPREFSLYFVEK